VLGTALRGDLEAIEAARLAGVCAECFAHDAHRVIWRAIEQAEKSTGSVDVVAVSALLRTGDAEESDYLGPVYLVELTEHACIAANFDAYTRELVTLATRRRMIDELVTLQRRLSHQEAFAKDDQALVAESFARLLASDPSVSDARPVADIAAGLIDILEERVKAHGVGGTRGVSTGFALLDNILGGWIGGRVYVVAARPSVGKTTLSVNFADAASAAGLPWAFFTLEMESADIVEKLLSKRARVGGAKLQSGELNDAEFDRIGHGLAELATMWGFVDNRSGRYVESFEVAVRRLVRKHGVRVVFLDYLQQMRARGRWANRQAELTEITDRIKQLALATGVAIVANAQLSREAEKAATPLMSHLKESGSIEQDADAVIFLHREKPEAPLTLVVAKNRWGRKGRVLIDSRLEINSFTQSSYNPEAND
jgi:replicative DNA helicase